MATLTVYAAAGDGTTWNGTLTAGQTWTACRNGTGGTLGAFYTGTTWNDNNDGYGCGRYKDGNNRWKILRDHCPFDTSALTAGATISAATINLVPNAHESGGGDFTIITQSTAASNTQLVAADYTAVGFTAWSDTINYASLVDGSYNVYTMNAAGLAGVSKTGFTKIALLSGADQTNVEPGAGTRSAVNMRSSEYADTTSDPYIEITYTVTAARRDSIGGGVASGGSLNF